LFFSFSARFDSIRFKRAEPFSLNPSFDRQASVSLAAMDMMATGVEQYTTTARGSVLSLTDQAKAKGDFATMDLLGGDSSDDGEKQGVKPSEVAALAMRKLRARRKSVSEGVPASALGSVDPRSPVVVATAEALQTIKPDEPYAEAIAAALLAAHKDALASADKATSKAPVDDRGHRIDMSRRNKACEEVGKALKLHLPHPLSMIGASLRVLEEMVGAKASAYFQVGLTHMAYMHVC